MSFVKINFQSIVLYPVKYKTSMSKISKNLGPRPPNIRKNIHINFINKWCKNVKRKKEKSENGAFYVPTGKLQKRAVWKRTYKCSEFQTLDCEW